MLNIPRFIQQQVPPTLAAFTLGVCVLLPACSNNKPAPTAVPAVPVVAAAVEQKDMPVQVQARK